MFSDVYLFNPTNELAIANGDPNYMPPIRLLQFERDLGTMPMFFAKKTDIVLVHKVPSKSFLTLWQKAGKKLPAFMKEDEALSDLAFCQQPKGFLCPWGWGPSIHRRLNPLKESCSDEFKSSPIAQWTESLREVYSRKTAAGVLTEVLRTAGENDWLLPLDESPVLCSQLEEITRLQSKWGRLVVKSPWSASGRGIQMLGANEFNQSSRQVISGFLKRQGYVMVEPWLNNVANLSLQFYSEAKGEVVYRGLSSFTTDAAGRYQGNYIRELTPGLSADEKSFLTDYVPVVRQLLQSVLSESIFSHMYHGWLGVDLLLYRDAGNKLRLHPCLEINSRYNMGALTLELREMISPESDGRWEITFDKSGRFSQDIEAQMSRFPVKVTDGKIAEGILPMVPPSEDAQFGVWLNVERS
jgi:hypothetical protein